MRSPSDRIEALKAKLDQFLANGTRLGWIVDPGERAVHIYRPGAAPEIWRNAETVAVHAPLEGFVLACISHKFL